MSVTTVTLTFARLQKPCLCILSLQNFVHFAFVLSLCIFYFEASIIHRPSKFLDPFSLFIILILGLKMLTVALDFYGFYVLLRLV